MDHIGFVGLRGFPPYFKLWKTRAISVKGAVSYRSVSAGYWGWRKEMGFARAKKPRPVTYVSNQLEPLSRESREGGGLFFLLFPLHESTDNKR